MVEDKPQNSNLRHANDHMANERTFLAWIRTSLGLMAFGFVVEKFSLFLRQVTAFLDEDLSKAISTPHPLQGYSAFFGIILVALGALICFFSYIKYKKTERQINSEKYQPSTILDIMLTLIIISMGIFLVIYLLHSLIINY